MICPRATGPPLRASKQTHNCFPPGRGQDLLMNPTQLIVGDSPVFQGEGVLTLRKDERLQVVKLRQSLA